MAIEKKQIIRSDKAKNKSKVIKDVLNDPLKSQRERAKDLWMWKTTVQWHMKDLKMTKDDRVLWVCDKDFEIVTIWQELIKQRLLNPKEVEKMRTFEIAQTIEKSEKRYMLFKWEATDKSWWAKNIQTIEII